MRATAEQDSGGNPAGTGELLDVIEVELMKLVRHLETFGRRSSLYVRVDRAGYLALRTLDELGPSRVNALAQALHLDASTVTRQVAVLESGGFVHRQSDPSDGRCSTIDLTAEGRRTMAGVQRERLRVIEDLLEGWEGNDVRALGRVMTMLNRSLADSVRDQSGEPVVV